MLCTGSWGWGASTCVNTAGVFTRPYALAIVWASPAPRAFSGGGGPRTRRRGGRDRGRWTWWVAVGAWIRRCRWGGCGASGCRCSWGGGLLGHVPVEVLDQGAVAAVGGVGRVLGVGCVELVVVDGLVVGVESGGALMRVGVELHARVVDGGRVEPFPGVDLEGGVGGGVALVDVCLEGVGGDGRVFIGYRSFMGASLCVRERADPFAHYYYIIGLTSSLTPLSCMPADRVTFRRC